MTKIAGSIQIHKSEDPNPHQNVMMIRNTANRNPDWKKAAYRRREVETNGLWAESTESMVSSRSGSWRIVCSSTSSSSRGQLLHQARGGGVSLCVSRSGSSESGSMHFAQSGSMHFAESGSVHFTNRELCILLNPDLDPCILLNPDLDPCILLNLDPDPRILLNLDPNSFFYMNPDSRSMYLDESGSMQCAESGSGSGSMHLAESWS
jgi:hypothetical protein